MECQDQTGARCSRRKKNTEVSDMAFVLGFLTPWIVALAVG